MTEVAVEPAASVAAKTGVPNEFIERLRGTVPVVEKVDTSIGVFYMRKQTAEDQWQYITMTQALKAKGHNRIPPSLVVAAALMNPDGTRVFPDLDAGFDFVNSISKKALNELFEHALRVTGIAERSVEDAEKK